MITFNASTPKTWRIIGADQRQENRVWWMNSTKYRDSRWTRIFTIDCVRSDFNWNIRILVQVPKYNW